MPTDDEFQEALATVRQYIEDVDGEVVGEIDAVDGDESAKGFVGDHGGTVYQVFGSPDWEFFRLQAKYEASHEVAGLLKAGELDADAVGGSGEVEVEIDEDDVEAGFRKMREIWSGNSDEERAQVAGALTQLLAREAAGYAVLKREGVPHGVRVVKKIYPYEDGFDRRRFDDAVMTVVDVLIPARQQLRNAFDVTGRVQIGSGSAEEAGAGQDRAFR